MDGILPPSRMKRGFTALAGDTGPPSAGCDDCGREEGDSGSEPLASVFDVAGEDLMGLIGDVWCVSVFVAEEEVRRVASVGPHTSVMALDSVWKISLVVSPSHGSAW